MKLEMSYATNNRLKLAGMLWIIAAAYFFVAEAITAAGFHKYSYITNYISDLGVPDIGFFQGRFLNSPRHAIMNTAFITQGLLFFTGALIMTKSIINGPRKQLLTLGTLAGLGWIFIGTFHGSQTNADSGLLIFHVGGAALSIISSVIAMIVVGFLIHRKSSSWYSVASLTLGVVAIVSSVMLIVDSSSTTINLLGDGVWERGIAYAILLWQFLTGLVLIKPKSKIVSL